MNELGSVPPVGRVPLIGDRIHNSRERRRVWTGRPSGSAYRGHRTRSGKAARAPPVCPFTTVRSRFRHITVRQGPEEA